MPDLGTNGPPPSRQRRLRAAATMRRLWVLARGNVRQEDIKVHEDHDVILVTPPIHVALPDASLIVMMEQATYSPEEERHLVEAAPSFDPLIVAQSQHTTLLMPVSSVGAATTASVSTPSSEDHLQTVEEETTEAAHEYPTGAQSSTLHTEEEERPKVCCVSAEAGHAQETAHDVPVPQSKRRKKKASIAAIAVEPPSAGCPILCTREQQLFKKLQRGPPATPDSDICATWGHGILSIMPCFSATKEMRRADIVHALCIVLVAEEIIGHPVFADDGSQGIYIVQLTEKTLAKLGIMADFDPLLASIIEA